MEVMPDPAETQLVRPVFETGKHHAAQILDKIASALPHNGYDDPRRDARHVLALAMGRDEAVLPHEDIILDNGIIAQLHDCIVRRSQGEPVSRLRGRREFYGLDFSINPATLDPRADSEVIVDTILDYADKNRPLRLLDCGTGSGCLLLASIAHLPHAVGLGVDIQNDAVLMAQHNAEALGLSERTRFYCTSWDDGVEGQFDVIISNPPYIASEDVNGLMKEVRLYDPIEALDGGVDGLDAWRALGSVFSTRLVDDGVVIVEIGSGQTDDVSHIMESKGLLLREERCDLAGVVRCLVFSHSL